MLEIELQTRDGRKVARSAVPFATPPEVITWGNRTFVLFSGYDQATGQPTVYREGMNWILFGEYDAKTGRIWLTPPPANSVL